MYLSPLLSTTYFHHFFLKYVLLIVGVVVIIGFSFALEISCHLVFYENKRDKPRMKYPSVVFLFFCCFFCFFCDCLVCLFVCDASKLANNLEHISC